jgi:hypothetical protein
MPRTKHTLADAFAAFLAPLARCVREETGRDVSPRALAETAKRTVRGWVANLLRRAADWLSPAEQPATAAAPDLVPPAEIPAPLPAPALEVIEPATVAHLLTAEPPAPLGWAAVETFAPELVEDKPEPAAAPDTDTVAAYLARVEAFPPEPVPVAPARKSRPKAKPRTMASAPRTTAKPAKAPRKPATGRTGAKAKPPTGAKAKAPAKSRAKAAA